MADLVRQIEAAAAAERVKMGVEPLGVEKNLAQDPETRPETLDRRRHSESPGAAAESG